MVTRVYNIGELSYFSYQKALFNIDVVVKVVKTVTSKDGNDHTGHYGN